MGWNLDLNLIFKKQPKCSWTLSFKISWLWHSFLWSNAIWAIFWIILFLFHRLSPAKMFKTTLCSKELYTFKYLFIHFLYELYIFVCILFLLWQCIIQIKVHCFEILLLILYVSHSHQVHVLEDEFIIEIFHCLFHNQSVDCNKEKITRGRIVLNLVFYTLHFIMIHMV